MNEGNIRSDVALFFTYAFMFGRQYMEVKTGTVIHKGGISLLEMAQRPADVLHPYVHIFIVLGSTLEHLSFVNIRNF